MNLQQMDPAVHAALQGLLNEAKHLHTGGEIYRSIGDRCTLYPEIDRVPPLLRGLDTYELTGKPRTPAYGRVRDLGPGQQFKNMPDVKEGDVVFLDLASVTAEVMMDRKRVWITRADHIIAIINEPRALPVPVNDYFLSEVLPKEALANMAPTLAELSNVALPTSALRDGLASDARNATLNHKILTHKFERIVATGEGLYVNKCWRPPESSPQITPKISRRKSCSLSTSA